MIPPQDLTHEVVDGWAFENRFRVVLAYLNMLTDAQLATLKDLLEKHHSWPGPYTFKFIVPADKTAKVEALFPNSNIDMKSSKKGKYTGLTITITLESADVVVAIYQKASNIKGLIAL